MNDQPTLPDHAHTISGEGTEERLGQLSALYDDYSRRFEQSGNLEDLDTAIDYCSQAVDLALPDNPPHQAAHLDGLAALHMRRYNRCGTVEDINRAIELYNRAVLVTPRMHPDLPERLKRLGDAFQNRFDHMNTPTDIERSIEYHNQAVMLTRDGLNNQASLDGAPLDTPLQTISDSMSTVEILKHLVAHGCSDMASNLQPLTESPWFSGGLGDVYRGTLKDGAEVAVKTLRMLVGVPGSDKLVKHAAKELYVWSKCDHPNVQKLLGVAEVRGQIAMVSPWMVNGDVRKFLGKENAVDRCSMCAQVADGLVYLHAKGIIHGDIKGMNVLVSHDHTLKLTDFGNAALEDYSLRFATNQTTRKISIRWSAPELLGDGGRYTFEADVYALGMTK
ncbi:hypothetical protein FRC08_015696 [Ceratobasidium sp. 394]|nr:hypothetical protein FRC08_015696 [Ceratobasidium sp. 394]KAG9094412.1 hypothetical protein FS749_012517 [Ceratobasidium sp. UAMH 11750]